MRWLYLFFILLLQTFNLSASHFFGGEITYECMGNDTFKISSTVYQNCGESNETGIPFSPSWRVTIFDGNNNTVFSENLTYYENTELDTLDIPIFDTCKLIPADICIHYHTFYDYIYLPYTEGGYTVTFQRCCLAEEIVNIVNPGEIGLNNTMHISEAALLECNNSPKFEAPAPAFFCLGTTFSFLQIASDIDGDSLVYSLIVPLEGPDLFNQNGLPAEAPPYTPHQLAAGYDANNLLGTTSTFTIDPQTGIITGTAQEEGLYLVGVKVSDYRNGQLLSEVVRTLVYAISECPKAITAAFTTEPSCEELGGVQFINHSENATNFAWNFELYETTETHPFVYFPDTNAYQITLIAAPEEACADTLQEVLQLAYPCGFTDFFTDFSLQSSATPLCLGEIATVDLPACEAYTYTWFPEPEISTTNPFQAHFSPSETTTYQLTIFDGDSCIWETSLALTILANCNKPILNIPTAFSPNEDGLNDFFVITSDFNLSHFQLKIYNRWGQEVYYSSDMEQQWNGFFNEQAAPSDVYVWMLEYSYPSENGMITERQAGDVTLLR